MEAGKEEQWSVQVRNVTEMIETAEKILLLWYLHLSDKFRVLMFQTECVPVALIALKL
jgi:hypothetical protein